jgi:hypothetical protein
MSSTMMMERTGVGYPGTSPMGGPSGVPAVSNWMMVPRCTFKFEKCTGGMKITCSCDDPTACSMVQNLCTMLAGGLCSCTVSLNGMTVCCCNFTMGLCKCETTPHGVSCSWTSGDQKCCEMIQSYCDYLCCMMNAGCTCCFCVNNTPICCGCCETTPTPTGKTPSKR